MYRRFTLLCCLLALVSCKQYSTVTETRPIFRPTATTTGALGATPAYLVKALTEESKDPLVALGDLLTATETASRELARHPDDLAAREAYNFTLARVFTKLRDAKIPAWDKPLMITGPGGNWELTGTSSVAKAPILAACRT